MYSESVPAKVDPRKIRMVLLRAHALTHLAPCVHLLDHFDGLQLTETFKIRSYLTKIIDHVRAVYTLCFVPYDGYIFDYVRMEAEFIAPRKQSFVNLRAQWKD